MDIEVTSADKLRALWQVLLEPKFYLQLSGVAVAFLIYGSMKRTARSMPTMVARFGLVIHWAALLAAFVLLCMAAMTVTNPGVTEAGWLFAFGEVATALIVWLLGKAVRYVLSGPSTEPVVTTLSRSSFTNATGASRRVCAARRHSAHARPLGLSGRPLEPHGWEVPASVRLLPEAPVLALEVRAEAERLCTSNGRR